MRDCFPLLKPVDFPAIRREELKVVQVNLGYRCNQSCNHCHVNAGPNRNEMMQPETMQEILAFMRASSVNILDLTGGAPEMNPIFFDFVTEAKNMGIHVIDRCNLSILLEPGFEGLAQFLADHQVEVVASLPCYEQENVDKQRGNGVFQASIQGLQQLNQLGYGLADSDLILNLVYNPTADFLPPAQHELEASYKQQLEEQHGIHFNHLFTITNVPIARFGSWLLSKGKFDPYMQTLKQAYRIKNLTSVMCRTLISIDWQGFVHDCDFNQMMKMSIASDDAQVHISQLNAASLNNQPIKVLNHCYACTAGQGSSCSGAL